MENLLLDLRAIVGMRHVLTKPESIRPYQTGYRYGAGNIFAVVRPGTLMEQWRSLCRLVAADVIVIPQAANTGLTGGSTADDEGYDRPVVLVSGLRMAGVALLDQGKQVICFPGTTLHELEKTLAPLGREPHSVIGSSCIGATVVGGICNNSGGSLLQRGPAYTELSLFAQLDASGSLRLVNHLGLDLGDDPEMILARLDALNISDADVKAGEVGKAHDCDYVSHVRDIDSPTPARYNADPLRLHEASGCAGRLVVFAVRLDTFAQETNSVVFYIGSNEAGDFTRLRRDVLGSFETLPIAAEYMHRTAFDIAEAYGKDTFLAIRWLGTHRLPALLKLKAFVDFWAHRSLRLGAGFSDRLLQGFSKYVPNHLPRRMRDYRDRYKHHLLLKVPQRGVDEARRYLSSEMRSATSDFFECTPEEAAKAFLHRFAAAGAAIRYAMTHRHEIQGIVALDVALPRNTQCWEETLPRTLDALIAHKLYYGHFFCHVFHQDYIVKKGHDLLEMEHQMWRLLDERGAEYPAEHNVGHLYNAKPALAGFYRALDPQNRFNPGIGHTSKARHWA